MSKQIAFIQVDDRVDVLEVGLSAATTLEELQRAIESAGVELEEERFIFIDDAEEPLAAQPHERLRGFRHGSRIHICRCRRIRTTVNFVDDSAERAFPPGARVRAVKEWAVHRFHLSPEDAAEHVLQLCNSEERPASDTPLHQLLRLDHHPQHCGHDQPPQHRCELCFDLVPDKRVEG